MEHIKSQSQGLVTSDRDHGHEESDINVKAIIGFGVFLLIGGIVAHVGLWGFYVFLDHRAETMSEAQTPIMQQVERELGRGTMGRKPEQEVTTQKKAETARQTLERLEAQFPAPRLQDDDVRDMNMLRARENELLNQYTWIDKSSGAVRIPVSRAMEVLAERGLPNVAGETPQSKTAAKPPAPSAPARQ